MILRWCLLQLTIFGTSAAFAPTFLIYCLLCFLSGCASVIILINGPLLSKSDFDLLHFPSLNLTLKFHLYLTLISQLGFLSVIEWIRPSSKVMAITLMSCALSLGQMILGGLAFLFRGWRTLQLVVSVPFLVIFFSSRYEPSFSSCLYGNLG